MDKNEYISSKPDIFVPHKATTDADPSWFGYAITLRDDKINREELLQHLNEHRVATRLMFGGNLIKQPAYSGRNFKVHNKLENADIVSESIILDRSLSGISNEMYDYVFQVFDDFFKLNTNHSRKAFDLIPYLYPS